MISRRDLTRYGGAVGGVALAVLARIALDPLLGDAYPLLTLFFAVVATAVLAGFGPTLITILLGLMAADLLFLPPRFSFGLERPQDMIGLGVFAALGLMTAALSRRADQTRQLAEEVAERRQAQAELQESRERLQAALNDRERFAFLVENARDFIGICDMDGIPFYVNRAGLEMVGLDGFDEFRRTHVGDYFFPEDRDFILNDFFPRVLREGAGEVEVRFRHFKTGEPIWMTYGVVAIRDSSGNPTALATVSRNVDERKRMEEALREQDRRKDDFIATLAHELRNPLAPVRNAVQVLKLADGDSPASRRAREILERQVGQMTRLVDDLLDVSRIRQGKIVVRRERIALRAVVQMAVETCRPQIEAAGHALQVELPPYDLEVDGDPSRLAQVVSNLLSNAAKYMDHGGSIRLSVAEEGGQAVIRIRDRGVGIPADLLDRIFDPFVQVDRSLHRSQGGLGIGLALVRSLVEIQGGTVAARSEGPGKGSEFVVRLPLAAPVTEAVVR